MREFFSSTSFIVIASIGMLFALVIGLGLLEQQRKRRLFKDICERWKKERQK